MNNSTKRYLKLIALLLIAIIVFLILNHFRVYFGVELIIALAILWGGVKFLRKRDTDFAEQDYDADDDEDDAVETDETVVVEAEQTDVAKTDEADVAEAVETVVVEAEQTDVAKTDEADIAEADGNDIKNESGE